MKIVVFDTGAGGKLFAEYIKKTYPNFVIETIIDANNSPYGNKSAVEIFDLTEAAVKNYIGKVGIIVLACNTATAVAIDELRAKYPNQIFIGFEPMLKTGTKLTRTGEVVVLATSSTKESDRYKRLKARFPETCFIEPNCDSWASKIDKGIFSNKDVKNAFEGQLGSADVIVLACTHYIAVSKQVQKVIGNKVIVINPFDAVGKYINKVALSTTNN